MFNKHVINECDIVSRLFGDWSTIVHVVMTVKWLLGVWPLKTEDGSVVKLLKAGGLHSTFSSLHPPPLGISFCPLRWHVLTCFQVFTIPSAPTDTVTGFGEVLMKHSSAHLFTYCLQLCLCYSGRKLIAHKAENISCLALSRKRLPTPVPDLSCNFQEIWWI